jgi:hypothetical protein
MFAMENGDNFTSTNLSKTPGAFAGYIPDFAALGYVKETDYVSLKNGAPYAFEGHYIANAPEEAVKDGSFYNYDGWTVVHWCVRTEPEYYDVIQSLGELEGLTQRDIYECFDKPGNQSRVTFTYKDALIVVYGNSAGELWEVLETLCAG